VRTGRIRRRGGREVQTKKTSRQPLSFRRGVLVILYWHGNKLVFENFALQTRITAEPLTCSILHYCGEWRSLGEIREFLNEYSETSVAESLKLLCETRVLERSDEKPDPRVKAMESWRSWNPAAGYFHFSTKDTPFAPDPMAAMKDLLVRAEHDPMPLPVKRYAGAPRTKLPQVESNAEFPEILRSRRTWRMYGREAVPLEALAQIMKLTFGIQGWVDVPGLGTAAMKTSPSCGCLHPTEAYVLAQRVEGLAGAFYHYNAARNELEWLRTGVTPKELEKSLGNQWWFSKAAFLVLMTAVFGRTHWKYEFPRVYRGILIEAGHLCQTFCLTATWLGLAPFSTIAQSDTQWEKWLGIDGVTESIIYVAGAGTRPKDMTAAHIGMLGKDKPPRKLWS
jgi:SagB-type dehydrogenase family enzyme